MCLSHREGLRVTRDTRKMMRVRAQNHRSCPRVGEQDPAAAHSDPRSRLTRGWAAVAERRLQPSGAVVLR